LVGAAILVVGLACAFLLALSTWRQTRQGRAVYDRAREAFGGALLLGIEVLVAADLLETVTVDPSLQSVAILGLIVLIRTFLSFSLDIELEGVVPWRKALIGGGKSSTASVPTSDPDTVPGRDGPADQFTAARPGGR
jgi:uncharacterized membrane protein